MSLLDSYILADHYCQCATLNRDEKEARWLTPLQLYSCAPYTFISLLSFLGVFFAKNRLIKSLVDKDSTSTTAKPNHVEKKHLAAMSKDSSQKAKITAAGRGGSMMHTSLRQIIETDMLPVPLRRRRAS